MINPNEAPKGFTACAGETDSCDGCAFMSIDCIVDGLNAYCCPEDRMDREHVIFVPRKPNVKLPQRYEVVSSGCAHKEDDGQWMRAEDVISELNAAGIAWERGCRGQ